MAKTSHFTAPLWMNIVNEQAKEDHMQHGQKFEIVVQQQLFPVSKSVARIP